MPATAKACRYYKLIDATRGDNAGRAVFITVWLNTNPPEPKRLLMPISGMQNNGKGNLFAADWLIKKKNKELISQGATATIRIDPMESFLK